MLTKRHLIFNKNLGVYTDDIQSSLYRDKGHDARTFFV